ncbi:MAG: hypothetical protein QOF43_2259 [Gaiellaceae bacterium]|jgi:hypothetical protein|nr:hypothetical protein [Gaiellaceae bacterium]
MSTRSDDVVAGYLAQLQDELRNVSAPVRRRVVRDIAVRIAAARDEPGADVRAILADVGDPLDIAAGVRELHGVQERSNWQEIAAIALLPFGGVVIPFAGWFVALYFLWASDVWTTREKAAATLVLPGGVLGPLLLVSAKSNSTGLVALAAALFLAACLGPTYLALRLRSARA